MKKLFLVSMLAIGIAFSGSAFAGSECSGGQCPMKSGACDKGGPDCKKGGSDCDKGGGCPILGKIMKKAHFFLENKSEIGLSEEQVSKIKAIKLATKKSEVKMGADMQLFMMDLDAKLGEEKVDVAGISSMIDEGMAAMATSSKTSIQWYADLKAVLTADQMAKAKEIWKKK